MAKHLRDPRQNSGDDFSVSVVATIEGHPESVLRDMQSPRRANTKRTVQLIVEVRKPPYRQYEPYWLPQIVNGDTNDAQEHLRSLYRQGRLSTEAQARVAALIENFGRATK